MTSGPQFKETDAALTFGIGMTALLLAFLLFGLMPLAMASYNQPIWVVVFSALWFPGAILVLAVVGYVVGWLVQRYVLE